MKPPAVGENVPVPEAISRARCRLNLLPWQNYLFDMIPEEDYVNYHESMHHLNGMWRFSTWEHLASDTVHCNGTQMPAILSMVYKPKVIVEMGVSDGSTTMLFCKLNPSARVYGVDCRSRAYSERKWTTRDAIPVPVGYTCMIQGVSNITLIVGNSWDLSLPNQVDLCFIDADHQGNAPYRDSLRAWDNRNRDGDWCIAWDDYHPSNSDVYNAVNQFVGEREQKLHQLGSWFWIGTKSPDEIEALRTPSCSKP